MIKLFYLLFFVIISVPSWAIPLEIIPGELGSFEMRVLLSVDGVDRDFQFDTGADSTIVAPDGQMMKYPVVGKASVGGASGSRIDCDLIKPNEIQIDRIKVFTPSLKRCDFGSHSLNNLGLDLLSGRILKIDTEANQLEVLDHFPFGISEEPLIRLNQGHLKVEAKLANNKLGGIFDTGAQLTAMDLQFTAENQHQFRLIGEIDAKDITGKPIRMLLYEVPHIKIGGVDFWNISVLAFNFPDELRDYFGEDTPLIIGNNIILQANWIIDLKSNKWGVAR